MKEHKKLYKAGKLWVTTTLFALVGVALTTTSASADTDDGQSAGQQTLVVNNSNMNSSNSITAFTQSADQISSNSNIQDLQNKVDNAQQQVDQAQQQVNDAQSEVNNQQTVVDNAKSNLQTAQNNLQAAGGDPTTVQQSITVSSDWVNAVKNYLATNGSTQDVSSSSSFGQELANYGAPLKSQNQYVSDPGLANITITLTDGGTGALDSSTELEITRYAISLLNPIRQQLGVDQYIITQQALDDSTNIAIQYGQDNWTIFNHGTHDFQVLSNNHHDGESLSDGYLTLNNGTATLDDIHRAVYNSIRDMLFDDADSSWGHATDLAGMRGDMNGIYLGVQIDKNGQVHFNGNLKYKAGWTYTDATGSFTEPDDTSTRIPLTTDDSAEALQLKAAVQDAQNQLNQANADLSNDQQALDQANQTLQNAQQALQQAKDALAAAPRAGWDTQYGDKRYRDNDGNYVDGWQKVDGQWYYFNNQVLVTDQVMSVPSNDEMQAGIYDFDSDGHYRTNYFAQSASDGNCYEFGYDGRAVSGLQYVNSNWYYFDPTYCYALTGWQNVSGSTYYFDLYNKSADRGLSTINGSTYYFDSFSGVQQSGLQTVNGNLYDFDGYNNAAQSGWQWVGGNQYYFNVTNYTAVSGLTTIDNELYYFDPYSHIEQTNCWETVSGDTYYFNPDAVDGLQNIDGNIYYFENNKRVDNDTLTLPAQNGVAAGTYKFDNNGVGIRVNLDGWHTNQDGKWMYQLDGQYIVGWRKIDNHWYYFDSTSKAADTSWQKVDGNWYYFDPTNAWAVTDWKKFNNKWYYFDPSNAWAVTGWKKLNNKWYYFDPSNAWAVTGWKKFNNKWYYLDLTNAWALNGLQKINGNIYYFNANNEMVTNTILRLATANGVNGGTYKFNANGVGTPDGWYASKDDKWMYQLDGQYIVGWQKIDNHWYHFDSTSKIADTSWQKIDGNWYYFDPTNAWAVTDWKKLNNKWYYFDPSNAWAVVGWKELNNKWYYFDLSNAWAVDGLQKIDNNIFYFVNTVMVTSQILHLTANNGLPSGNYKFDANGYGQLLFTGWKKDTSGKWTYQLNDVFVTNWQKLNDKWYYFDPVNNWAVTGWNNINDQKYYFDPTNAWATTNWAKLDNNWYYFDPTNAWATTGWKELANKWYYFDTTNAYAVTGWKKINNQWYYFDPTNAWMLTGTQKINNRTYVFSKSGELLS